MSIAQTELARPGASPPLPVSVPGAAISDELPTTAVVPPLRAPTRSEWTAAGLSVLIHLLLMLVLLALLIPVRQHPAGTSIDGGLGADEGNGGELFDSVTIGSPDPGKGQDLEKTPIPAVDGASAIEGAMAGSAGSGTGRGHVDVLAGLGNGGGGSGKGVGFFGQRARADSVVFIVDMSDSMNDDRRFTRAIDELVRSLNALEPAQKFFIFFYNNQTYPLMGRPDRLLAATPATRAKAVKWIKSLVPSGGTQPDEAMERSLKMKPQVIYFLTDGEIPESVRETARHGNPDHKTVIHTIAFVFEGGEEILRGIAVDNRGKYRFIR